MQKNGTDCFGIFQVPSATARTSRPVAFVTAHSRIPYWKKIPFQKTSSTHRPTSSNKKHFLSAFHTTVFTAAFFIQAHKEYLRKLTVSESTIFLRVCFPRLPTLSQVPPVYSRHSLFGCKSTGFLCRLYTSVTAHRSIAQFQVFTALCTCLFPFVLHLWLSLNRRFVHKKK